MKPVLKSNNNCSIKITISGNSYFRLMEEVEELIEEICANRSQPFHKRVDMSDRRSGCIADVAFGIVLSQLGIKWSKPTNYKGQTRNPYNNSDYGDYLINGKVYDVKGSSKYKNISFKYNPQQERWMNPISYLVGSHVKEYGESVVIEYYGVLDYATAEECDIKPHVSVAVIPPTAFGEFPFKVRTNRIVL